MRKICLPRASMSLLLVAGLFLGLLWLTQTLVRRGMDDGSGEAED